MALFRRNSPLLLTLSPAGVAWLYVFFAALWIVVSGYLVTSTVADPLIWGRIELLKGLAFVAVTGVLLYLLLKSRGTEAAPEAAASPVGMRLMLIFVALALVVPLIGFAIARLYAPQIEREAYANLEAIARLKAGQIENWLAERQGDGEVLAGNENLAEQAGKLALKHDAQLARMIHERFDLLRRSERYDKILLLDTRGNLLVASGEDETSTPAHPGLLHEALESRQVRRRDLYRDQEGDIHMEWAVPLAVQDARGGRAVAVIVLRVTAQRFIFPLIQSWPSASTSGETLLVRRDGESIMFLNDLRHRKDAALKLTLPTEDRDRPAVLAVRSGGQGTVQGLDYRDVPVLTAYLPVADTDWHIVAKIDRAEVMAPLRDLVLWVSLIALAAIAAVSAAVMVLWRQQQRAHRVEVRERSMAAIERSERHFHSLFENMLEGYAHCRMLYRDGVPEDFVFLETNPAFERLSGLDDVVGKRATEAIPGVRESNPDLFEIYGRVARSGQPERFEMYVDMLERWFAITVYCPESEHFVAIFDNVTARKQSEQVLAESEQRFRSLVEQSLAGIYIIQDGKFAYVNPRFAEIFGYASPRELVGVEPVALVAEHDRELVAENMRRRLEGEVQNVSYSFTAVCKDGSLIEVGVHGARATHLGRPAVIGLLQDVSEKKRAEEQIQGYIVQLEESFLHTIEVATTLVEMRDPYTAGHEKRVAQIAVAIGTELGLDAKRIEGLRVGGYIHDIGKIIVPAEILSKPGNISPVEYLMIKAHPQAGYDILKNVDFPWPVADIAYQHHERMDGSGYPRGLKGEEILLEARIVAVADVVEAMSSHRPYRPGIALNQAIEEIERGSGSHYDPEVAAACLRLFREKGYTLPA
jgi:PAS domain S-box-containing protein/putative nucleotidyltransferase with HDIG domain